MTARELYLILCKSKRLHELAVFSLNRSNIYGGCVFEGETKLISIRYVVVFKIELFFAHYEVIRILIDFTGFIQRRCLTNAIFIAVRLNERYDLIRVWYYNARHINIRFTCSEYPMRSSKRDIAIVAVFYNDNRPSYIAFVLKLLDKVFVFCPIGHIVYRAYLPRVDHVRVFHREAELLHGFSVQCAQSIAIHAGVVWHNRHTTLF